MRNINDVEFYQDEYGNTRQLTTVDHSPKERFYFYGKMTEADKGRVNLEMQMHLMARKEKIRTIDTNTLQSLLVIYPHLINYETDISGFLWDSDKLEILMYDEMNMKYLEDCIEDSKTKNNHDSI